jgi:hypothetical protein
LLAKAVGVRVKNMLDSMDDGSNRLIASKTSAAQWPEKRPTNAIPDLARIMWRMSTPEETSGHMGFLPDGKIYHWCMKL